MRLSLILICIMLTGCAAFGAMPSVCDNEAESLICAKASELGVKVEDIDLLLQVASLRFLEGGNKQIALDFFDAVETVLTENITYRFLIEFVQARVQLTGPEILIISRYLPAFDSSRVISTFDQGLILQHIANQRAILQ